CAAWDESLSGYIV
nr:immunoglobulin light chain junction region [Macaca mulatta]